MPSRTTRRLAPLAAAVAVTLTAALASTTPAFAGKPVPSPTATYPKHSASALATSPIVAAQATGRGRTVHDLAVQDGLLYLGYGDYGANTGPMQVHTVDPATGAVSGSLLTIPSEEISVFRSIGGALYAPMIDPTLAWTAKVGYATNASGSWENRFNAPAVHVFDVASLDGHDLWMVGSSGASDPEIAATAYRSTDGGTTWDKVATDTSIEPTGYERYYWVAPLNGKMYLQAASVTEGAPLRVFDGTSWSTVPGVQPCANFDPQMVVTFKDQLVCGDGLGVRVFDGTTATTDTSIGAVRDFFVAADGYLYVLGQYGVARTADGAVWTPVSTAPAEATAVAVVGTTLYLGTASSQVLRVDGLDLAALPDGTQTAPVKGSGKDKQEPLTARHAARAGLPEGVPPSQRVRRVVSRDWGRGGPASAGTGPARSLARRAGPQRCGSPRW